MKRRAKTVVVYPRATKRARYATVPSDLNLAEKIAFKKMDAFMRRGRARAARGDPISNVKVKYVDGFLNKTNIHELDDDLDDTWADTELNPRQVTAVYGCLPVPKVGDGYSNRDDRRIKILKIKLRGYIEWAEESGLTQAMMDGKFVRIVVVQDTRTGGAQCQAENVIGAGKGSDDNNTVSGIGGAINFFTNPNGWGRYKVLKDFIIKKRPNNAFYDGVDGNSNGNQVPFKCTIKPRCIVNFSGTTGAIGSIVDNSFHVFAACSVDRQVAPKMSYYARTTFIDA